MAPNPDINIDVQLRDVLAMVAPGTALRDGLERILRGQTGALIVLGRDKIVDAEYKECAAEVEAVIVADSGTTAQALNLLTVSIRSIKLRN